MSKPVLPVLASASGMLVFALAGSTPAQAQDCGAGAAKTRAGISVGSGQDVVVCGGRVSGSILVHPGGSLTVENAQVTGGIKSSGATSVTLCGDGIGGSLAIDHTTGPVSVGDPDDPFGSCAGNTIGGSLRVEYNQQGVDVSDNTIHGSMSFDHNAGSFDSSFCPGVCTFEPEVGDNFVFGAIDCEDNGGTPAGVYTDGAPDRAGGAILGDCAAEGMVK